MTTLSKMELRARFRTKRRHLPPEFIREQSAAIVRRVLSLRPFVDAKIVGCYLALPGEVQVMELIYTALDMRKRVAVPAWDAEADEYRLVEFRSGLEMVAGPAGVLQPREAEWIQPSAIDVMVVPGVAFDRSGGRLGHGGGHFDRLLTGLRACKVGVAFEIQVLMDALPVGPHDVPVDLVVTEIGTYPRAE